MSGLVNLLKQLAAVPLSLAYGGTGATSAAGALAKLGINGVGATSYRNRIINGIFNINQRAMSTASTTYSASTYPIDRWKAGSSGVTASYTMLSSGIGVVNVTAGTLLQIIEGTLYIPEGGTYVLSWNGSAKARVYQGSAAGSYASSPIVVTGMTAGTNTTIEFSPGQFTQVQFEPGSSPTAFEYRDDELDRCLRYYVTGTVRGPISPGNGNTYVGALQRFPQPVRASSGTLIWTDGVGNRERLSTGSGDNRPLYGGAIVTTAQHIYIDAVLPSADLNWFYFNYYYDTEL